MTVRRSVRLEGQRVHVECYGDGPPLLLLHGFTGSARSMSGLGGRLAGHFRVIAPDLPGHGASDSPDDPAAHGMDRSVSLLAALLDVLDAAPAHLLGYSMGGRVALHLCVRRPERVRSAVLIGASAGLVDPAERAARRRSDEALAASILREGVPSFADRWSRLPLFATQQRRLSRAEREAQARQRLANRAIGLANSLRGMGSGAQQPLHGALPRVRVPLLLLAGRDDPKFQAIAREMAALLPRAEVAVVPDAGHAAHLENPDDVAARALRHFLSHDPTAAQPRPAVAPGCDDDGEPQRDRGDATW